MSGFRIISADVCEKKKKIVIIAENSEFYTGEESLRLKKNLCERLQTEQIEFIATCKEPPASAVNRACFWPEILNYIHGADPAGWALLEGSSCRYDEPENQLIVQLSQAAGLLLVGRKADLLVRT